MLIKNNPLFRNLALALVTFATIFAAVPALAYAHGVDAKAITGLNQANNHDGEHDGDKDDRGQKRGPEFFKNVLGNITFRGVISTKTSTGFTINRLMNDSITVDTTNATIIKLPSQTITLADLVVGDYVAIVGTKTNNNIVATKVYMVPSTIHPAAVKGSVTAVSGNTITVQNKKGNTVTVNTTADTQITNKDGSTATTSNITVGSNLKIAGFWDSVLNILTALRIHIK